MWLTLRPTADQVKKLSTRSPLLGVDLPRFCGPRGLSDAPRSSLLSTNSELFHEICRFCGRVAQRCASPCAATLIWREIGSPCAKNWGLPGHSGCPRGGAELRHAQMGLHLSTLCFTFQQAPVFGVELMADPPVGSTRVEVQNMAKRKRRKAAAKRKPATKRRAKKAVAKKAPAKRRRRKSKKAVAKKAPAKRKRRKSAKKK